MRVHLFQQVIIKSLPYLQYNHKLVHWPVTYYDIQVALVPAGEAAGIDTIIERAKSML